MKLVEFLARELEEWPEGVVRMCQSVVDSEFYGENDPGDCIFRAYPKSSSGNPLSEAAYEYVTRAQWQAERDRQKGGEWKRHRGGKQPVADGTAIEVRYREGETKECFAGDTYSKHWSHSGFERDIMQYRVISQPQAEEVEYRGPFPCAPAGEVESAIELDIEFPSGVCSVESKTDQIDGPIKWRDQIVELEAHAEDIQREIASLFAKLNSEGFQLIRQYPVVSTDVQIVIPYEEWADGDVVRCVKTNRSLAVLTIGKEYTVIYEQGRIGVIDDEGDHMGSCIEQGELEFVRRP